VRASYPNLWNRSGYPPKVYVAAAVGDVVHGALEDFLQTLREVAAEAEPGAAGVLALRRLGGYTALIERRVEREIERLAGNPRMATRSDSLRAQLEQRVPEMRQRVQGVVSRLELGAIGIRAAPGGRGPLAPGLYPEIALEAATLRFSGRADLLRLDGAGVTITDYKTGEPSPEHHDQVRLYALLWQLDEERNPSGSLATQLTIAYASHDEVVAAPDRTQLKELAAALLDRIAATELELAERPPPARPSAETCRYCPVRQLCDDYWIDPNQPVVSNTPSGATVFGDSAGIVGQRNGPRSWLLEPDGARRPLLLRTPTEDSGFDSGDRLRLLDIAFGADTDSGLVVATITHGSEVFVVAS
jgi:CRISPR/Cas system-associated exonuclease Cas4 (RecB family)